MITESDMRKQLQAFAATISQQQLKDPSQYPTSAPAPARFPTAAWPPADASVLGLHLRRMGAAMRNIVPQRGGQLSGSCAKSQEILTRIRSPVIGPSYPYFAVFRRPEKSRK